MRLLRLYLAVLSLLALAGSSRGSAPAPSIFNSQNMTKCSYSTGSNLAKTTLAVCLPVNATSTVVIPFSAMTNHHGEKAVTWGAAYVWYLIPGNKFDWDKCIAETGGRDWSSYNKNSNLKLMRRSVKLTASKTGLTLIVNTTGKEYNRTNLAQNESLCNNTMQNTAWNKSDVFTRADLWWYCGDDDGQILNFIPFNMTTNCALISLIMPMTVIKTTTSDTTKLMMHDTKSPFRRKRNYVKQPGEDPTYIDAIGVQRGVPDECKLADQVAAGFENIPILSALFPVTPNKNVDRINYVHYNVQRLSNLTTNALEGLRQQLEATSLTAFQNRIALDMLLAEKGGVCSMFGDRCCTFIPNNTDSDGTVGEALNGLRMLSKKMKDHSGVDTSPFGIFESMFRKYKAMVLAALAAVITMVMFMICCSCCGIPLLRGLIARSLDRMTDPKYRQMVIHDSADEYVAVSHSGGCGEETNDQGDDDVYSLDILNLY